MKILVLYEELAWYFVNCMNELATAYPCEVLIVSGRSNKAAPFQFNQVHPAIRLLNRDNLSGQELFKEVSAFAPDRVFIGGWKYKPYLDLIKQIKPRVTVIGFDNAWTGSLKQRLGALYFKLFIKPHVQHAFVPGKKQHEFASRLGFKEKYISEGAYCCDQALFSAYHAKSRVEKENNFPKRFLYAGRYAKEKGVGDLWETFISWQDEKPNDWELWCLGKGDIVPPPHPKIRHFGFLQPEEMEEIIKNTGVFVLPSIFEPWGVVVQEFAVAGFPLLCSDSVGAAGTFLADGKNGFLFEAGNKTQLKEKMNKFSTLNKEELVAMARESVVRAAAITPRIWAARLMYMFKNE